jgi:hypothetical protein
MDKVHKLVHKLINKEHLIINQKYLVKNNQINNNNIIN